MAAGPAAGVRRLLRGHPAYPELLGHIFDPPEVLYVDGRGDWPAGLAGPAVALVGSRDATAYGLATARSLARALAENGIVYARGPGIAPGSLIEDMSVNDVTPTVLAWLGLPLGADMDGRPAGFVELEAIETIATYDTTEIEHVGEGGDTVEAQILDQLRTLGYVD